MRARMAIAISGQQVEFREVILRDKPSSMIKLSPKGTVPVLSLSSGQVIDESLDVIDWALKLNDPDNWLRSNKSEKSLELIHTNDNEFKHIWIGINIQKDMTMKTLLFIEKNV